MCVCLHARECVCACLFNFYLFWGFLVGFVLFKTGFLCNPGCPGTL